MRIRQTQNNKAYKGKYKTDKLAIMETEQANINKAVVQVAAEAAKVAVQAMAMASTVTIKGHRMWDLN